MYLQIIKTEPCLNSSILSIGENEVVGIYGEASAAIQRLYWRINPKGKQILFSIDIDERGKIICAELILYKGQIGRRPIARPPSPVESDQNVVYVATEYWLAPNESTERLGTAWKYLDTDMSVVLTLDQSSLLLQLGDLLPVSTIRMDVNWSLGIGPNRELCALFIDGVDGKSQAEILRRVES